jgi:hypothetical protein
MYLNMLLGLNPPPIGGIIPPPIGGIGGIPGILLPIGSVVDGKPAIGKVYDSLTDFFSCEISLMMSSRSLLLERIFFAVP